jgi:hypothetical protein
MGLLVPILTYKYKMNVGIVSQDKQSLTTFENGMLFAEKKGCISTLALDWTNLNPMKSTLMVRYKNNRYYWLKIKTAN